MNDKEVIRILLLASGNGTNAEAIVKYFQAKNLPVDFVGGCSKPREEAGVYNRLEKLGVQVHLVHPLKPQKNDFSMLRDFLNKSPKFKLIIMAGYMWRLPDDIVETYDVLNIHPSILPFRYQGSKDAYEDALKNEDSYTGCTVHKATRVLDGGPVLAQIAFEIPDFVRETHDLDMLKAYGLLHEYPLYSKVAEHVVFEKPLSPDDMLDIAEQAQANLAARGLAGTTTILPPFGNRKFTEFDPDCPTHYCQRITASR